MSEQKLREALQRLPELVCQTVAEIPDRNSPEDWPEAMIVTPKELLDIVERKIEVILEATQPTSDEGKALIDKMVDRFLSWPLPKDFMPDGGISFKPIPNHQPIGTNLLTAEQARKMIEHMQGDR